MRPRPSTTSRPGLRAAFLASAAVLALLVACGGSTTAGAERLCAPGEYFFCRCKDRQEGSKLCNDDGASFGPCEPCIADDLDGEPGRVEPSPRRDAGGDAVRPRPPTCGNAVIELGEDCDDGDADEANGCDANCALAGTTPAASNACPGLLVHVWGGTHAPTLVTKTSGSGNRRASPSCGGAYPTSGAAAPDRVFQVVTHAAGTMTVEASDATYNVFLFASEACAADANPWLACVNASDEAAGESLSFPVDAEKTYWVFLDGHYASVPSPPPKEGAARVTFSIR